MVPPFTIYDCTNALNGCPRVVNAPDVSFHGTPVANGQVGGYNYLNIPLDSQNPYTNSQGFSDFPDALGGTQNVGMGRNQFHGPNNYSFDMGVYKNIAVGRSDRYTVQLRAEFYDILNHHNFYPVTTDADFAEESTVTALKGTPTLSPSSTDERRNTQLAIRLQF